MAFFDLPLSDIWDDVVGFVTGDNEDEAAAEIAAETKNAEVVARQTAAPSGTGGFASAPLPAWVWWVGGAAALLLTFRMLR